MLLEIEPRHFRITTKVFEHILHEALFYKLRYFKDRTLPCFRYCMICPWKEKNAS